MDERVRSQLDKWRNELIDLERGNRLLYFRHTKRSTLEITRPAPRQLLAGLGTVARKGWDFYLPPVVEDDQAPPVPTPRSNELLTSKPDAKSVLDALRSLERRTTQEFMDKGLWVLYLGIGMLSWRDPDNDQIGHSPLRLVPVSLHRPTPREPFRLYRAEEDSVINPALAVKLSTEFNIDLSFADEIDELQPDPLFDAVRDAIVDHDWTVHPRIVLSTFSFHKEVMYRDLMENAGQIVSHPLVRALALGSDGETGFDFEPVPEEDIDEKIPFEQAETILDADASQRQCIAAACAGNTFVMDGPPGTGKSQTISNVIAELLEQQKTVLFVSEKAAALEVVHTRLQDAGLDPYVLELHSHKATRREVAAELGRALVQQPKAPRAVDASRLEGLVARRRQLSAYAAAMNETRRPLRQSLHQVLGRVSALQSLPQAPLPTTIGSELAPDVLARLVDDARALSRAWAPVSRGEGFLWRDLREDDIDTGRTRQIREQLERAKQAVDRLVAVAGPASSAVGLDWRRSPHDAARLAALLEHLEQRRPVPTAWLTVDSLDNARSRYEDLRHTSERHDQLASGLEHQVGPRWRDLIPEASRSLEGALSRLRSSAVPLELPSSMDSALALEIAELAEEAEDILGRSRDNVGRITQILGLPTAELSPRRALDLAAMSSLAASQVRPEGDWLDPIAIAAVKAATGVLSQLIGEYRRKRDELATTFSDEVLNLDLEGLMARFSSVHHGLGRLRKSYRDDKRSLAPCLLSRKVTKDALALLPAALEWQRLYRRLEQAEMEYAPRLGGRYYQGVDTDFAALTAAIENANIVLDTVGERLDRERLRKNLAIDGDPDPELVFAARSLQTSLSVWLAKARALLGDQAESFATNPLSACMSWGGIARRAFSTIGALLGTVETTCGRSTLGQVAPLLESRCEIDEIESGLVDTRSADTELLGPGYQGLDTDWQNLRAALDWTETLRELVDGPVSRSVADRILGAEAEVEPVREALNSWRKLRDGVAGFFTDQRATELAADLDISFTEADGLLTDLESSITDIDEWIEFCRACRDLEEAGLQAAVSFCIERRIRAEDVPGVLERAILERWADDVIRQDEGRLRPVRAQDRDHYVEEFRTLDRDLIEHARARVVRACNAIRPTTTAGSAGIIEREANKKKKHMPVRDLMHRAGPTIQALKPCFMMSPRTVSQFLPSTMRFDVVIFDEASQVRPSDAINCIYRGSQLIVAGDQKQLPPTSFFERISLDEDDEYEEEQFDEFESILDLSKASGSIRSLPLRWHYRSKHEDLITYSNYSFYNENPLLTFPSSAQEAPDLGVELLHVPDGVYRRGGPRDNPVEAAKVVERVLFHTEHHPEFSVGVVAFSEAQAAAIEIELDRQRREKPWLDEFFGDDRLRGFFVKNLENVQGDERDIIIFSVGYGRDEAGKFTLQLGPLNKRGGHRRLNVAITRARRRVEIVSSVSAADFGGDAKAEGVRHLKRYLDFAERGRAALALELDDVGGDVESPFEEEVARAIRSWGYEVVSQVGAAEYRIDLGVRDPERPGRFLLGVECDGAMYHSSKVARDRDRLRHEILEGLGWQLHRIWGTAWYRYRAHEEERLRAAIEGARSSTGASRRQPARRASAKIEFEEVDLSERPDWAIPYVVAKPRPPQWWTEMHEPSARPEISRMIKQVVEVESPVSYEVVLRRVREAWDVGRAGSRIRSNFDDALRYLRHEVRRYRDGFLRLPESRPEKVRVPVDGETDTRRDIDEVSPEEIRLAASNVVRDARSITRDELTSVVARTFGWNRRGAEIAAALEDVVDSLVADGTLERHADHLRPKP